MELQLEQLKYQTTAINSVLEVFEGQQKNTFDNACSDGIRSNYLSLSPKEVSENIKAVIQKNGIEIESASISDDLELCVEMETGTGKTLVYIKTLYELYKNYGFSKFIILVPSVAIKEGVLSTFKTFENQLENIYNVKPNIFEYNSKKLPQVSSFVEEQHLQVMVMTLQSFNSDDNILNQAKREDLFSNLPFIEAIAKTRPIVMMDEPQEGMDTENSIARLSKLNPLCKIRYSATHKIFKNLIYRLTPFQSYKEGLVKKIEVLTVSEKNDEASMKIELTEIKLGKSEPQVVLKAWHNTATGFKFKKTKKLSQGDLLSDSKITNNVIYNDYVIDQIKKPIRGKGFVKFKNGAVIYEGEQAKDYSAIFGEQLYWLIDTHFRKKKELNAKGIKCLSLVFIDKVDNYIREDGLIKIAFEEQFKKVYKEQFSKEPTAEEIKNIQGYYFSQTGKGDYSDNENAMKKNKTLFDLILKDKKELLSLDNPVEIIFSHSALGVGWDNPNIFNIATLNQSYSEIKKRQEIGRGLRICVDEIGQRIYDKEDVEEGQEINLLTVIPNETYEVFVGQYQAEINEVYGDNSECPETRNNHKGEKLSERKIKRNETTFNSKSFKNFWDKLARKTEFLVSFNENNLIQKSIEALDEIEITEHQVQVTLSRIEGFDERDIQTSNLGTETKTLKTDFSPIDIIEEISENTALAYPTVFEIIKGFKNRKNLIKNPPRFIQEAIHRIKEIELDEMLRGLSYQATGETLDKDLFPAEIIKNSDKLQATPQRGIYDHIIYDSDIEKEFAFEADRDTEVVCFLKLPGFYKIETPVGNYNPDFGVILKRKSLRNDVESEYYFVIETKGTNDLKDRKALTANEVYKIKCAMKHFEALGINAQFKSNDSAETVNTTSNKYSHYVAPIKDYSSFKAKVEA